MCPNPVFKAATPVKGHKRQQQNDMPLNRSVKPASVYFPVVNIGSVHVHPSMSLCSHHERTMHPILKAFVADFDIN